MIIYCKITTSLIVLKLSVHVLYCYVSFVSNFKLRWEKKLNIIQKKIENIMNIGNQALFKDRQGVSGRRAALMYIPSQL